MNLFFKSKQLIKDKETGISESYRLIFSLIAKFNFSRTRKRPQGKKRELRRLKLRIDVRK